MKSGSAEDHNVLTNSNAKIDEALELASSDRGSLLMKQRLKLAYHEGLMSTSAMSSQPEAKQQNRAKIPGRSHI
ncbi:hypothetical protein ANCCAN_19342 [Ancylostoma caninum]|uniref:Uncharacterized protein n=1 Tax=Ancylostoma caninum TaxID=29170 RepID=A0A368FRM5_ANCCA|nr:hypothetical protein ANCCAN_19342 [Ancylostoma caninum]